MSYLAESYWLQINLYIDFCMEGRLGILFPISVIASIALGGMFG